MLVCVCSVLHALFFNMSLLISAAIVDRAPSGRPGRPVACGCATPRSPREAAPAAGRPRRPARDDVDRRATASTVDRASRQPSETAPRAGPRRRQVSRSGERRHGQRDERETRQRRGDRGRGGGGARAAAGAHTADSFEVGARTGKRPVRPTRNGAGARTAGAAAPRPKAKRAIPIRPRKVPCRRGPVVPAADGPRHAVRSPRVNPASVERAGFVRLSLLFKKPYRVRRTGATAFQVQVLALFCALRGPRSPRATATRADARLRRCPALRYGFTRGCVR